MRHRKPKELLVQTELTGTLGDEARHILKEKRERLATDRARRAAQFVPNYACYPMLFGAGMPWDYDPLTGRYRDSKGARRLPKCRVCEDTLHPKENHVCPGFTPKYVEHDETWHERQEAKQEEIRASKEHIIRCGGCGAVLEDEDDARWHDEHCEHDSDGWRREHYALNGDEDDLSGYEDEPEDDYCEDDGDDGD